MEGREEKSGAAQDRSEPDQSRESERGGEIELNNEKKRGFEQSR